MKMTQSRYAELVELMNAALTKRGLTYEMIFAATLVNDRIKNPKVAAVWNVFHMVVRDNSEFLHICYADGLNDSQIETALFAWLDGKKATLNAKPTKSRAVTIKAPCRKKGEPETTVELTGSVLYINVFGERIRCLYHDSKVTHYASGLCLLNEQRIKEARAIYLHEQGKRPSPVQAAQLAFDLIAQRMTPARAKETIANAPVINH